MPPARAGLPARCTHVSPGSLPSPVSQVVPLGFMFFCILFNYTILRDTKDVLVVTAPGSGAEIIPFLKTWCARHTGPSFTRAASEVPGGMGRRA